MSDTPFVETYLWRKAVKEFDFSIFQNEGGSNRKSDETVKVMEKFAKDLGLHSEPEMQVNYPEFSMKIDTGSNEEGKDKNPGKILPRSWSQSRSAENPQPQKPYYCNTS